jgi:hypothetical protein
MLGIACPALTRANKFGRFQDIMFWLRLYWLEAEESSCLIYNQQLAD